LIANHTKLIFQVAASGFEGIRINGERSTQHNAAVFSVPKTNLRVPHISLVFREMWDTGVSLLNR
jgi:hypothetical protein